MNHIHLASLDKTLQLHLVANTIWPSTVLRTKGNKHHLRPCTYVHETLLRAPVRTWQPPYIPETDIIHSPFMVHFMNRREDLISTEEPSTKITWSYILDKICILLCRSSPLRGREGRRGQTETKTLCQRDA